MPAPIQQIYMAIRMLNMLNPLKYWYDGSPIPRVPINIPTNGMKYWYNGGPAHTTY